MQWLKKSWHNFWDWIHEKKDRLSLWWVETPPLRKIKDIFLFGLKCTAKSLLIYWFMSWTADAVQIVAGVIAGTMPKVKDKTWEVILGLIGSITTVFLFYWVWELFVLVVGLWLWNLFEEGYQVGVDTFREKGFWKGILFVLWREVGVLLGPLFDSHVKTMARVWLHKRRPTDGSLYVRARNKTEIEFPDATPELDDEQSYNASRRPEMGRRVVVNSLFKEYENRVLPIKEDSNRMVPGLRYVVEYSIEKHDADRAGTHIDFSFRGPKTGMVHRWALQAKGNGLPSFEKGRAEAQKNPKKDSIPLLGKVNKPVAGVGSVKNRHRVRAIKTDDKHGHKVMKNPKVIPKGSYGAGTTTVLEEGKAVVWVSRNGNMHVLTNEGQAFAIVEPMSSEQGKFISPLLGISNQTVGGLRDVKSGSLLSGRVAKEKQNFYLFVALKDSPKGGKVKPIYRERPINFKDGSRDTRTIKKLWTTMESGSKMIAERKYDGSLVWLVREKDGDQVQVLSNRPKINQGKTIPLGNGDSLGINRAHWIPGVRDLDQEVIPVDTRILAEVIPRDRYRKKTHSRVSSVLNSQPGRALELQAEEGELIVKLIRVERFGGRDRTQLFRDELDDRKFREELSSKSRGVLHVPEVARTPDGAVKLYERVVLEGGEGIVVKGGALNSTQWKFKARQEFEKKPIGIFRGRGKYRNSAGGILYGTKVKKPGRVASGLTDGQRQELWSNPESLLGEDNVKQEGDILMASSLDKVPVTIEVTGMSENEFGVVRAPVLERIKV